MRILILIDQWILGEFENFAHMFQRLTGKNNFWLARFCAVAVCAVLLRKDHKVGDFLGAIFIWFVLTSGVNATEKAVARNLVNGLKNSLAQNKVSVYLRLYALMFLVSTIPIPWVSSLYPLFLWLHLEFMACTPLPPAPSKIGEWYRAFTAKPVDSVPDAV